MQQVKYRFANMFLIVTKRHAPIAVRKWRGVASYIAAMQGSRSFLGPVMGTR
jgi:hypothetical protein